MKHGAALLSFLFIFFADAQSQMMPSAVTPRGAIVMMPEGRKELKVTNQQMDKIQKALDEFGKKANSGQIGGLDLSNPMSILDQPVQEILDEAQRARLEQLFVHVNKGFALSDKKVVSQLTLAEDQSTKITEIFTQSKSELMNMIMSMRSQGDANNFKAKRKEFSDRLLGILNSEQLASFELLKGKPFKFKE